MHRIMLLVFAASLAAAPAMAQNEVAPATAGNADSAIATPEVNATADLNVTNVTDPAAATPIESEVATDDSLDVEDSDRGFPWGLIGLVGLIGLLGRRRGS